MNSLNSERILMGKTSLRKNIISNFDVFSNPASPESIVNEFYDIGQINSVSVANSK